MTISLFVVILLVLLCVYFKSNQKEIESQTVEYWSFEDAKKVSELLVNDLLQSEKVALAINDLKPKTPVIYVTDLLNRSSEHINTTTLTKNIETLLFNSGKVEAFINMEEASADFKLIGTIHSEVHRSKHFTKKIYIVFAELLHNESNQRIWMGREEVQKTNINRIEPLE